jgi:glutathione peroxidase
MRNFQKYLINEKGELVKVIKPKTLPTDPEIINWIKS